jgi:hypothetical protein
MNATRTSVKHDPEPGAMNPNAGTAFDIDRQSGGNISNVGGDQTIYYVDRSRATRLGKIVATLGLLLSLAGVALLVSIGVTTAHRVMHAGGLHMRYTHYVPRYWPAAVGLLLGGFVIRRFVRIMVGR